MKVNVQPAYNEQELFEKWLAQAKLDNTRLSLRCSQKLRRLFHRYYRLTYTAVEMTWPERERLSLRVGSKVWSIMLDWSAAQFCLEVERWS